MIWLKTSFVLPSAADPALFLEEIGEIDVVSRQEVEKECFHYLDTFDWHLYRKGWICMRRGLDHYTFSDFSGTEVRTGTGPANPVPLGREFLSTPLSNGLKSLFGIRSLLPCVEVERTKRFFLLLNKDEKTILRFCIEQNNCSWDGLSLDTGCCLRVYGLRGYGKTFHRLRKMLIEKGLEEGCGEDLLLQQALAVRERLPLDYSSKLTVTLDGRESIAEAAQDIFLLLEEDMARNVPGILQDWDSEFLHDYRVALRRSRSLLSTFKKMIPETEYHAMQEGLKRISAITGPVRDLDVYLLEQESYQAMLPKSLQQGLKEFFAALGTSRGQEFKRLQQGLQSSGYAEFMDQWLGFVRKQFSGLTGTRGKQPCAAAAAKFIRKRLERILQAGELINEQSPDEELHRLRIQCKKLRYLLEFYRSLFSEKSMATCIRQLKKLQDNLGSFNDLSVQQEMLSRYHEQQTPRSKKNLHIAAALGGLITHLQKDQQKVRKIAERAMRNSPLTRIELFFTICWQRPLTRKRKGRQREHYCHLFE